MAALDHVAVYVNDLEATREFYERYLGATSNDGYHNPKTGLRTYFLSFEGTGRVEIMNRPGHDLDPAEGRRGWIHTAFKLGSEQAVASWPTGSGQTALP